MNDVKIKHVSGAYKYLPGYPDYSDVIFVLSKTKKAEITVEELMKLTGCEKEKLTDPLILAVQQGNLEKLADDRYKILNTKFKEIEYTE